MAKRAAFAFLLTMASASSILAQTSNYGESLGDMYLSFSPTERVSERTVSVGERFEFFLVVEVDYGDIGRADWNVGRGIGGWEANIQLSPDFIVTRITLKPASSVNVCDRCYIIGVGTLISAAETPFAVLEFEGLFMEEPVAPSRVSLGAASPSSFDDPGGPGLVPGWSEFHTTGECNGPCLRGFANWENGSLTVVSGDVANRDTSWTTLKAQY